ncbi:hypothetical protein HBP99_11940 [Listeria booriae]|uniref:hypothetical protein n=1 Tax=Listeria booriae TaxID=1552123 RepID=UPI00162661F6|nr:hypothetical protein [Listeria booriae]MBC2369350.1 hypothetical protein [Listeria booriae]
MEIRESQSGAMVDLDDQEIIAKFNAEINKYNSAQVKVESILSSGHTDQLRMLAEGTTIRLLKDGIPESFWDEVYDKLSIPNNLRGIENLGRQ